MMYILTDYIWIFGKCFMASFSLPPVTSTIHILVERGSGTYEEVLVDFMAGSWQERQTSHAIMGGL